VTTLLALAFLAAACGSSALNCPNDLPNGCQNPVPSYKTDVAPIVQTHCLKCHAPGGQEASIDFTTYQHVFARRQSILTQVFSCRMPPEGEPAPTAAERALLLGWLTCGSPNN
jgi:uncharacterized membrane protein